MPNEFYFYELYYFLDKSDREDSNGSSINVDIKKMKKRKLKILKSDELKLDDSEVQENRSELTCQYCDMKFRSKVRLKKHETKHKIGFKCHICGKTITKFRLCAR